MKYYISINTYRIRNIEKFKVFIAKINVNLNAIRTLYNKIYLN